METQDHRTRKTQNHMYWKSRS